MLVHHGSNTYDVAASDAATHARGILESRIESGRIKGSQVLEKIMTEIPMDRLASGGALSFDGDILCRPVGSSKSLYLGFSSNGQQISMDIHRHAMGQLYAKANIPARYGNWLQEQDRLEWGPSLLAENLSTIYKNSKSRYLLRSYKDTLRGFLSDRYRRMDSRPLVESFASACKGVGALPIEGYASDTKVGLKAILPLVFEPVPNEVMSFGILWENSDYGNGRHSLQAFVVRLWCTNYAILSESFSQVHLGKRLNDDILYSDMTYKLDTQTICSAINDVVRTTLSSDSVEAICGIVRRANEAELSPKELTKAIRSMGSRISKAEKTSLIENFNEPDVIELPPGNTVWRLSNSLSWVANRSDDSERKVELMKLAGEVLEWMRLYHY